MYTSMGNPIVHIDLPKGVFLLPPESAVGKTYLSNTLRLLQRTGEPVTSITLADMPYVRKCGANLPPNPVVVMFDRYDAYVPECNGLISELGKVCTVLVDYKGVGPIPHGRSCDISYASGRIEVGPVGVRV